MQEKSSLLFDKLSYREKDTVALGAALAGLILQDDGGKGSFIALYGNLGAGKTAFVRGMASVLTPGDRKSTRLNSSHRCTSRMPSSA